jgi:hypothetical protein
MHSIDTFNGILYLWAFTSGGTTSISGPVFKNLGVDEKPVTAV